MKKYKKKAVVFLTLLTMSPAFAIFGVGDVVFDPAAFEQKTAQWIEQGIEWSKELERWKQSYEIAKKEFESISGIRDIGKLRAIFAMFNFDGMSNNIANSGDLANIGFDSLDESTQKVFKQLGIGETCDNLSSEEYKKLCQTKIMYQMGNLQNQQDQIQELKISVCKLKSLAQKAMKSKDIKESQDIANQISIVQANLQAQELRNQMRLQNEQRMEKLVSQREQEIYMANLWKIKAPSSKKSYTRGLPPEKQQQIKMTW